MKARNPVTALFGTMESRLHELDQLVRAGTAKDKEAPDGTTPPSQPSTPRPDDQTTAKGNGWGVAALFCFPTRRLGVGRHPRLPSVSTGSTGAEAQSEEASKRCPTRTESGPPQTHIPELDAAWEASRDLFENRLRAPHTRITMPCRPLCSAACHAHCPPCDMPHAHAGT